MKYIPLTQGKFAIVDDEDYDWLIQRKWCVEKNRNTYYCRCRTKTGMVAMHRMIMVPGHDLQVDHINHNGLDNRRGNLRICTLAQNLYHKQPQKGSTSRYKGITRNRIGRWQVCIMHKNKSHYLGCYLSEIFAAAVYYKKAKQLFGEFAYLNFPEALLKQAKA